MKHLLAGLALILGTAALSGCYYDPGYSYVRGSAYSGDAYYGDGGGAVVYDDYYAPGYYAAPGYYGGYAPGVSVGIGTVWYGGSSHRDRRHWGRGDYRGNYRGSYHGDRRGDRGNWRGGGDRRDDSHRGDRGGHRDSQSSYRGNRAGYRDSRGTDSERRSHRRGRDDDRR